MSWASASVAWCQWCHSGVGSTHRRTGNRSRTLACWKIASAVTTDGDAGEEPGVVAEHEQGQDEARLGERRVERVQTGGGEPVHVLDAVVHGVEPPQERHLVGEPVAPVAPEQHDDGRAASPTRGPGSAASRSRRRSGTRGSAAATTRATVATATGTVLSEEVGEVGDETGPQHPLALQRHGPLERDEHQTQQRDARRAPGAG